MVELALSRCGEALYDGRSVARGIGSHGVGMGDAHEEAEPLWYCYELCMMYQCFEGEQQAAADQSSRSQ